jgi:peptide/nickel transport system permease protein
MGRYIGQRLAMLVPVTLGVTFVVFATMYLTPGDPALLMAGPLATAADIQQLRADMGLDQPLLVQYATWLGKAVRGDLGRSFSMNVSVAAEIGQKLGPTLILTVAALGFSTVCGLLAGIISATRPNSLFDRASMVLALVGVSMPVFWLGIVLMLIFSLQLRWLPASGMYSATSTGGLDELFRHLVLPAVTLGLASTGIVARFTRSSMLEVIRQDYIRTARAKGLSERLVYYRHALKNALIPVVTVVGLQVGFLLGGAVLTETVFSWPGLGSLLIRGIATRDFPLVQGCVLVIATMFVLVNLVVDLLYAYLDPKVRYE